MIEKGLDHKESATYDEAKGKILQYLHELDSEKISLYFDRFDFPLGVIHDEEVQDLLARQLDALRSEELRLVYGNDVIDHVIRVLQNRFEV